MFKAVKFLAIIPLENRRKKAGFEGKNLLQSTEKLFEGYFSLECPNLSHVATLRAIYFLLVLTFILRCDKIIVGLGTTPITKNEGSVYSKGDDTHRKKRNCC